MMKKKLPWRRVSSKIVHTNPYWQVAEDNVIVPTGAPGKYYRVERTDFVTVIPLLDNNRKTMLVRQWRYPTQYRKTYPRKSHYSWEFSAGGMDVGERPLSAAKREFEEETGMKAKRWKQIGSTYLANSMTAQRQFVFVALDLYPGVQQLEATEADMIVETVSLAEVRKMVATEKLQDGPTIIGMYFLEQYLAKKL
jgi:8-oxo-dGTP pyrophosphatase MutT (NUDIX family)